MNNIIDFDEASAAWRANKKPIGGGWFAYKCEYIHSNGKQCNKTVEAAKKPQTYKLRENFICTSISRAPDNYCWQHRNRISALQITDGIGIDE